jgi:hypothetical protein
MNKNKVMEKALLCFLSDTPHGFSPPEATPFLTISAFGSLRDDGGLTRSLGSLVLTVRFKTFSFAHGAVTSRSVNE